MLHRINHKLYGFACLIIVLSLLIFAGVALFLDLETRAATEGQSAQVSAREFASLQQAFIQLRTWELDLLLLGEATPDKYFVPTIQRLKQQLRAYQQESTHQQVKEEVGLIISSVQQYEDNFNQLLQHISRHRQLETDLQRIYQSIETAALRQGDATLLRKIFLLNHFQVDYLTVARPSGFQALKIVMESMASAFDLAGSLDGRIGGYFTAYERALDSYNLLSTEILQIGETLEKSHLTTMDLFEKLSSDLVLESNNAIASSIDRRHLLKTVMYIYFPSVSFIVFFISLFLARKIAAPINALLSTINKIKAENSRHRFTPVGDPEHELNQLGLSFNSMLDALDVKQDETLGYQAELTRNFSELAEINKKLQREMADRSLANQEKLVLEEQLRQSQKMEAIGTLAGGIAHDFNNLLAAIIGYTQLTTRRLADGSKEKRNMGEVLKAAERGKQLVKQILAFSWKTKEKRELILISDVVEEALRLLRHMIPATVPIHTAITPQTGSVWANATQVHQIVMNLCTNAYHAVRDVHGTIDVRLEAVEIDQQRSLQLSNITPGNYAQLTFKDTGIGIPAEVRSRIFEPFFTTKKQGEGTGMGLAVVYGIIQTLGGSIDLETEVGVGTLVRVLLPLSEATAAVVETVPVDDIEQGSERILFIDDEEALTTLWKETLEEWGYQVTATTSARKALQLFRADSSSYDLIISDQSMPEMSGADLVSAMMQIRPNSLFILCSGYSETMDVGRAQGMGVKAFLLKPFDQSRLSQTIREVLDAASVPGANSEEMQGQIHSLTLSAGGSLEVDAQQGY
jgi:signal transduction histidine kinase/FixJ family two-component response regulator/uncharacterized protein YbgA (DUF1722 family)